MPPQYDLDKIKFTTDEPTFEKAVDLYEGGKVTRFKKMMDGYSAVVIGTKPYQVSVSARHHDRGNCECYLGQNDMLCKHMVAVAVYAIMGGKKLSQEDKQLIGSPRCSGQLRTPDKAELAEIKKAITGAMKYIKPYNGPSRTWFSYQDSLIEGCNRLSKIVSELPVNPETAGLLVDMLLRLDNKLSRGGIDDSDGAVGGFMEETVQVLQEYAKCNPSCIKTFSIMKLLAAELRGILQGSIYNQKPTVSDTFPAR